MSRGGSLLQSLKSQDGGPDPTRRVEGFSQDDVAACEGEALRWAAGIFYAVELDLLETVLPFPFADDAVLRWSKQQLRGAMNSDDGGVAGFRCRVAVDFEAGQIERDKAWYSLCSSIQLRWVPCRYIQQDEGAAIRSDLDIADFVEFRRRNENFFGLVAEEIPKNANHSGVYDCGIIDCKAEIKYLVGECRVDYYPCRCVDQDDAVIAVTEDCK